MTAKRSKPAHARRREQPTVVTFSPLAWLKLLMFLHAGDTEIGGFGISSATNLLHIENFVTVKQAVTSITVAFDDIAVADYFDACIDRDLPPARFGRIWLHTHPGASAQPSCVDEETFGRVFGNCDWALMLIVSRTHETYARLSFSAGPGGSVVLPVQVDWAAWPQALLDQSAAMSAMFEKWMDEYGQNIHPAPLSADLWPDRDGRPRGTRWKETEWREAELLRLHEQSRVDNAFAEYFDSRGRFDGLEDFDLARMEDR